MIDHDYEIELPVCLVERYDKIASLSGKTRERLIKNALEMYIESIENAHEAKSL